MQLTTHGPTTQPAPAPAVADDRPDADLLAAIVAEFDRLEPGPSTCPEDAELRKILRHRHRIQSELARAKENEKIVVGRLAAELAAFDYKFYVRAEDLTRTLLARTGHKSKSIATSWGVAGLKWAPDAIEVVAPLAIIEAVEKNLIPGDCVKTTVEVSKSNLNKLFATGEVPPGCEVIPGREKFYIGKAP